MQLSQAMQTKMNDLWKKWPKLLFSTSLFLLERHSLLSELSLNGTAKLLKVTQQAVPIMNFSLRGSEQSD